MFKLDLFEGNIRHTFEASDKEGVIRKVKGWLAHRYSKSVTLTEGDGKQVTIFCAWLIVWSGKECRFPCLEKAAVAFTDACWHQIVEVDNESHLDN